jgi:hypothetical protein
LDFLEGDPGGDAGDAADGTVEATGSTDVALEAGMLFIYPMLTQSSQSKFQSMPVSQPAAKSELAEMVKEKRHSLRFLLAYDMHGKSYTASLLGSLVQVHFVSLPIGTHPFTPDLPLEKSRDLTRRLLQRTVSLC